MIWLRFTVRGYQSRRLEGVADAAGGSAGDLSSPAEPGAHAAMREINGLTIHQRAASHDARYASARALLRCRRRDAPLAKGAVEPDTPDVPVSGLPNDLLRDAGVRGDDEAIQITGYAGKVRIAFYACDFGGVRVNGKHFVTGVAQFAEHGVRGAIWPARYARDGDTLSAQKFRNERGQLSHRHLLRQIQPQRTLHSKHTGGTVVGAGAPCGCRCGALAPQEGTTEEAAGKIHTIVIPSPVRFLNGVRNLLFPWTFTKSRSLAPLGMTKARNGKSGLGGRGHDPDGSRDRCIVPLRAGERRDAGPRSWDCADMGRRSPARLQG